MAVKIQTKFMLLAWTGAVFGCTASPADPLTGLSPSGDDGGTAVVDAARADAGLLDAMPSDGSSPDEEPLRVRPDSTCFEAAVPSSQGRFEPYEDERFDGDRQYFFLMSEPTQQGCMQVQGGIDVGVTPHAVIRDGPSRRLFANVRICNTCDGPVSVLFRYGRNRFPKPDFINTDDPLQKAHRQWPLHATYDVDLLIDSITRTDFPDGVTFLGGCYLTFYSLGTSSRRLVLQPDESLNMRWSLLRQNSMNPKADLPSEWEAPAGGVLRLVPSIAFGDDPSNIPELLPRVCRKTGYRNIWRLEEGLCFGRCQEEDELNASDFPKPSECPYACPESGSPISVEIKLEPPYPEDLFYAKQAWH